MLQIVSKSGKYIAGVISDGNMDRGPMMFTSDVSLPKDDKIAKRDRKSTRLNSSHKTESRMPSSA